MRRQFQPPFPLLAAAWLAAAHALAAAAFEPDADRDAFTPSAYCVDASRGLVEPSR